MFVKLTRYDAMTQMHYPITLDPDSIECFTAVEKGRWDAYNSEVTLKSGQTFLCQELHDTIMERLDELNNTGGPGS